MGLALVLAAAAHAQVDAPEDMGGTGVNADTDFTPVAKEYEGWQRIAGADFGADHVDEGSTTTYGTDLYTVVFPFANAQLGFAGGSVCAQEPERRDGEPLEKFREDVRNCRPRVPVIYRFSKFQVDDPTVEGGVRDVEEWRSEELPGLKEPGYVGAIAFIDSDHALAVGGTGEYVRREQSAEGMDYDEWVDADPAADARAWLWERERGWSELTVPDGMRGLTAVAFEPSLEPRVGYAGGVGQLWTWTGTWTGPLQDRELTGRFAGEVADLRSQGLGAFRFRVRAVQLQKYPQGLRAAATTAGCCHPDATLNAPLGLFHNGARWTGAGLDTNAATAPATPRSYYDFGFVGTSGPKSLLAAPDGPESDTELDAQGLYTGFITQQGLHRNAKVGTARFIAFDGTAAGGGEDNPNTPRWTVGVLRSTGQALAESTHLDKPGTTNTKPVTGVPSTGSVTTTENWGVGTGGFGLNNPDLQIDVDPEQTKRFIASYNYFKLPAYALNAIEMVEPFGIGWAVGDHGAILKVGDSGAAFQGASPQAFQQRLPTRGRRELPSGNAYEPFRPPAAGPPGPLPDYLGGPASGPGFVSGGWVDANAAGETVPKVRDFAIARDGSEGWALAPGAERPLYRYDGEVWDRCDPFGIKGQLPPDDACADARLTVSGKEAVPLFAVARVPLEWDSDPTNDDEFEAIALTSKLDGGRMETLRYRHDAGSWEPDTALPATSLSPSSGEIVLSTPTDGFARGGGAAAELFYHYNGSDWVDCITAADEATKARCGNSQGVLPGNSASGLQLASAGKRLYLYGGRAPLRAGAATTPLILYRDPGGQWQRLLDPASEGSAWSGIVQALAVAPRGESFEGWALAPGGPQGRQGNVLLRLDGGEVSEWTARDSSAEYLSISDPAPGNPGRLTGGGGAPFVFDPPGQGPLLAFDENMERWEVLAAPFVNETTFGSAHLGAGARIDAMAPDGAGGFWSALRPLNHAGEGVAFERYTPRVPRQVLQPAAQPLQHELRALAASPDGQLWLAQDTGELARYDRVTGWETVRIPGWDTPTTTEEVSALAVGPDGRGVAVGRRGRVANIGPDGVQLDPATGTVCDGTRTVPPCGTSRDLRAVAVAPDGSAIAVGDNMTIIWRPAGGDFRMIGRPLDSGPGTNITFISLPSPKRAYLATDAGQIFEGALGASGWRWQLANTNEKGELLTLAPDGQSTVALRGIAVGPDGHGYAVGDQGLLLERIPDAELPWRRLRTPYSVDLTSVALPVGGGEEAVVGGHGGLVVALRGTETSLVRPADPFDPAGGRVAGLAVLPGLAPGQTEAWAALGHGPGRRSATSALLHYTSEPSEPLLNPRSPRSDAMADTPAARDGELSFAAFGKSDCILTQGDDLAPCSEFAGTDIFNELVLRRIVEEVSARPRARFALWTGHVADVTVASGVEPPVSGVPDRCGSSCSPPPPLDHNRFLDFVAEPLDGAGVPLLGAIGQGDLDARLARTGQSAQWRRAMERRPAPWGTSDEELRSDGLTLEPAPGQEADRLDDPGDDRELTGPKMVAGGQARTHYAVDVLRDDQEDPVARIVVLDTSQRSLVLADPHQQPLEPNGGQQGFLERMLCFRGDATATGERCTREPTQQAIVLSTTPTYSYGPGAGDDTATDGALLESLLLRYRANVLVTGRIGWQGRYWATAPGLHEPCPGDPYQPDTAVPEAGGRFCGRSVSLPVEPEATEAVTSQVESPDPSQLSDAQRALGQLGGTGILPVVVSSSAGGKLADPHGSASAGFWHGYSIVRLDASGDPRKTIVEQRPIFDWVQITGADRELLPKQRVSLEGVGREPLATDASRFDELDSYAITHRYELVLADPEEPWLPCAASEADCRSLHSALAAGPRSFDSAAAPGSGSAQDDSGGASGEVARSARDDIGKCGPYLCLPERLGTIDPVTGEVRAGNGKYPDTFALATLSLGCVPEDEEQTSCSTDTPGVHSATYPLVFKKSPSFVVNTAFALPEIPSVPTGGSSAPPPPSPPNPPHPSVPQPSLPQPPAPPTIAALPAAQPPEPQPPAPPVPALPTEQPSPLDLTVSPTALTVSTPAAVIQPPTPPVNPAPPSGARREARQRQAAAQRSGAGIDSDEPLEGVDPSEAQGRPDDIAVRGESMSRRAPDRSPSAGPLEASRRDRTRPAPSFTPIASAEQPSAWARGALYSGGIALGALVLALGFSTIRPRPGSRQPELPAAAHALVRRGSR